MENSEERMAAEVLQVLKLLTQDDYKKIPIELISYLEGKCNYRVATTIDSTKKISVQDVCPGTLDMIGQIYRTYLATPEEKEKIQRAQGYSDNSKAIFEKLAGEKPRSSSTVDDRTME